jgi:hypothetical protein
LPLPLPLVPPAVAVVDEEDEEGGGTAVGADDKKAILAVVGDSATFDSTQRRILRVRLVLPPRLLRLILGFCYNEDISCTSLLDIEQCVSFRMSNRTLQLRKAIVVRSSAR